MKFLPVLMAVALGVVACSAPPVPARQEPQTVKVLHIFQGKVEIADALKRMAQAYDEEHPGIHLEIETVGGGQDYDVALADRFQAGTFPDVFMSTGYENIGPWVDMAEDLSTEPWVKDLRPGTIDPVLRDGKILGNPVAIEGYGFLYNKALFRQAGITILPRTLAELDKVCQTLKSHGILPFANGYAEWWVLGVHNFNLLLGTVPSVAELVDGLNTGVMPRSVTASFQAWVDLLLLTSRWGLPDATLTGDYTTSVAQFLSGKAAMLQQGNWIEPDLVRSAPGLDVGVLSPPLGPAFLDRLPMGVPNYWIVNRNSPFKGEAKRWFEWMRSSSTGRRFLIQELKVIPPYRSLEKEPVGHLSAVFARAWHEGRTLPWVFPRYANKTKPIAAAMRAYLEHPVSSASFWNSLSRAWRGR